jgi:pyrimidine-nucleoside phosphorylase
LREAVDSGRAAEKFREIVAAQGGDAGVVDDVTILPRAPIERVLEAAADGYACQVEPRTIGEAIVSMGGGRSTVDDVIDHAAGMVVFVKPGDRIDKGQPLGSVAGRDETAVVDGMAALERAIRIGDEPPTPTPLISHRVTADGVTPFDY